jgi:predicted acyltransferase
VGTPSWGMLCNGISILLFAFLFYILDVKKIQMWAKPFLPAGQNSLTTYLAPDILYFIIWTFGLNILFYKQTEMPWLAVSGSIVWAFTMIGFAALLSRINIRLKL